MLWFLPKKTCKRCGKIFAPTSKLQPYCSYDCKVRMDIKKEKEKKKKAREKYLSSVSVLTRKADAVFGQYIRLRDSLDTTGNIKSCICITCGANVENIQCWHFVSRASRSTRWTEKNANWQCPRCNCFSSGKQYEHWVAIDKKYWPGTADLLVRLGNEVEKVTSDLLRDIIERYTEKIYLLKQEKDLDFL